MDVLVSCLLHTSTYQHDGNRTCVCLGSRLYDACCTSRNPSPPAWTNLEPVLHSEGSQPCTTVPILSGDYAPASDGFSTDPLAMGTVPMPVSFTRHSMSDITSSCALHHVCISTRHFPDQARCCCAQLLLDGRVGKGERCRCVYPSTCNVGSKKIALASAQGYGDPDSIYNQF